MSMIVTGIIDYFGQSHCMEHASTVSSYAREVYEGEALECWCGRDLSIESLTPWDADAEEERAEDDFFGSAPEVYDVTEFTASCPDVLKGCSHTMVQSEEGTGSGCLEWIEGQCPEGYRPVFIEGDEFGPARWIWEALSAEDVAVRAVVASGELRKGSIVDVPGVGRGVVVDRASLAGESLVRFYVTPEGGDWFDTNHGRWIEDASLTVRGFDREAMVWYAARLTRAGDTLS